MAKEHRPQPINKPANPDRGSKGRTIPTPPSSKPAPPKK